MGMIDVGSKPVVRREALAEGIIMLKETTIEAIKMGSVRKGNPLSAAEIAGMLAAKQTHLLIPHCHQIPLDSVDLSFEAGKSSIRAVCRVVAQARTGVEMEALVGVSAALNTIWDMVKYLEKDESGQYPGTEISQIRVVKKSKAL